MPRILVVQHARCESLGTIAEALEDAGVSVQYIRSFEGQPVPKEMDDAAGLILMGGPMGVYDHTRYPFLCNEMALIERALQQGKPVLGVCLGSQLLAAALGTKVVRGEYKEIGWYPVRLSPAAEVDRLWSRVEAPFRAYHWHGDLFDLPTGAVLLASSDLTACQAFRYGTNAYGFLFHLEVTGSIIHNMLLAFSDECVGACVSGPDIIAQARNHLPRLQEIGALVFGRWASLLGRSGN